MYKLIIAGGRDFNDEPVMIAAFNKFVRESGLQDSNVEVVSGTAKGADSLGAELAKSNGIALKEFPADWKNLAVTPCRIKAGAYGQYNALAGMNRNKQMGEYADGALIFWNGSSTGTKDMINQMISLRKEVIVVRY